MSLSFWNFPFSSPALNHLWKSSLSRSSAPTRNFNSTAWRLLRAYHVIHNAQECKHSTLPFSLHSSGGGKKSKEKYLESFIVFSIPIKANLFIYLPLVTIQITGMFMSPYTYWAQGLIIHNLVSRLNIPLCQPRLDFLIICFKIIFNTQF